MLTRFLAVVAILLFGAGAKADAPKSWEFHGPGHWQELPTANDTDARANPTDSAKHPFPLDTVDQLLARGRNKSAMRMALAWWKRNPDSPHRDRALFQMARANYQMDDRIKAYYYLEQLLDEHPDSSLFLTALAFQYDIADAYLKGYKRRVLGLKIWGAEEEAIEMLYRIQQRVPGAPIAERALLRTADYYFEDRQYDFAVDAYAVFLRTYPRSPDVPHAMVRRAYSSYLQFRGRKFEVAPLIDAREQLLTFAAAYPMSARQEDVPDLLAHIDQTLASKLYITADYYRRTRRPQAAAYTYRYLTQAYPNSAEAQRAHRQLQRLPEWALEIPEPTIQDRSVLGGDGVMDLR